MARLPRQPTAHHLPRRPFSLSLPRRTKTAHSTRVPPLAAGLAISTAASGLSAASKAQNTSRNPGRRQALLHMENQDIQKQTRAQGRRCTWQRGILHAPLQPVDRPHVLTVGVSQSSEGTRVSLPSRSPYPSHATTRPGRHHAPRHTAASTHLHTRVRPRPRLGRIARPQKRGRQENGDEGSTARTSVHMTLWQGTACTTTLRAQDVGP